MRYIITMKCDTYYEHLFLDVSDISIYCVVEFTSLKFKIFQKFNLLNIYADAVPDMNVVLPKKIKTKISNTSTANCYETNQLCYTLMSILLQDII